MSACLFDPAAVLQPLLEAQPESKAITTCWYCHRPIIGRAGLNAAGMWMHHECPPRPPAQPPEGCML